MQLACTDVCMTDAEKIRLEQLMSDAPIEAFIGPGTITDLRKEVYLQRYLNLYEPLRPNSQLKCIRTDLKMLK